MPTTPSTSEVRAWARGRGYQVGDRGRLSPTLVAEYLADRKVTPGSETAEPIGQRAYAAPALRGRTVRAKQAWDWKRQPAR